MTKKVKNSSQPGSLNKALPEKAKKAVDTIVDDIKKADGELDNSQDSFGFGGITVEAKPAKPFEATVVEPVNIPQRFSKYGRRVDITRKPELIVGGKEIELVVLKPEEYPRALSSTFYNHDKDNILVAPRDTSKHSVAHPGCTLERKDLKVYKAIVNGTEIFMTAGSSLIVKETVVKNGCSDPWDLEEGFNSTSIKDQDPVLVLIGSELTTSLLNVNGYNLLNNSSLESKTTYLMNSRVIASRLHSEETIDLDSTNLNSSVISGTKWLRSSKSDLALLNLGGIRHITLERVSTRGDGSFSLTTWANKDRLSLRIADITLTEFNMNFSSDDLPLDKNTGPDTVININRRVDYGYFSGIIHVPFIRINKFDMLVGDNVFTGKELNPTSFPQEEKKEELLPNPSPYGYTPPLYRPAPYSMGGARMDDTWNKARKIISFQAAGHNYSGKQNPLGTLGESLVDTLVDQIRSRNKLYIELFSFVK
ncbi:hypothetical protein OBP_183 [Pseudomonas phage OBP]|uniref:hypothetical protein n=1 Tax=Pseudomonas phage OBP TaxID=1124849 RepID=UPI000240D597|nr:hypothetical protein OBP_183 [Pseudomonas phage OBP]AEV89620.1 hypothetical protein OBP_183 [Pseudomonas phage OBP]